MMTQEQYPRQIYVVQTEGDVEGRSMKTLGYAIGQPQDIRRFYDDKKMYRIELTRMPLVHVTRDAMDQRAQLRQEAGRLEQRLVKVRGALRRLQP